VAAAVAALALAASRLGWLERSPPAGPSRAKAEAAAAVPPPALAVPAPPPLAAAPGPAATQPEAPLAPAAPARSARPPAPRRAPAAVSILVRPYAQRALLDGVEVARGTQRVLVALEPGRAHHLEISHDCCTTFMRDFAADEEVPAALELKVSLEPRPARLRVQADPAARILVDGRPVGTAGDSQRAPIPVPVPPGGDSPYEGDAEIRIEADDRPPFATTARIRAGTDLTVVASEAEVQP
jgi:serine/threonine-protein kinase